jgi:hypothetical protein
MPRYCLFCEHAYDNNRDLKKDGFRGNSDACRAYPYEIPYGYPKGDHEQIQPNQTGNYTFKQVSDEMRGIAYKDEELGDARFAEFGRY